MDILRRIYDRFPVLKCEVNTYQEDSKWSVDKSSRMRKFIAKIKIELLISGNPPNLLKSRKRTQSINLIKRSITEQNWIRRFWFFSIRYSGKHILLIWTTIPYTVSDNYVKARSIKLKGKGYRTQLRLASVVVRTLVGTRSFFKTIPLLPPISPMIIA